MRMKFAQRSLTLSHRRSSNVLWAGRDRKHGCGPDFEFAKALLDDWMSSPGHRENILHKSARYLGCACVPLLEDASMEKIYCTQVFFTP
jgi:uncharacterized protein YkwD